MASTVLRAQLTLGFTVVEDHGGAPSGVAIESPFDLFNDQLPMFPTGTPPAALLSIYKTVIGAGFTIDLTAAQGSNGNVNGTGKRIQAIRVSSPSASIGNVTIAVGGANGYALPASIVVPPGGETLVYLADAGGQDIDATHKNLAVSGNAADTPEIGILLG